MPGQEVGQDLVLARPSHTFLEVPPASSPILFLCDVQRLLVRRRFPPPSGTLRHLSGARDACACVCGWVGACVGMCARMHALILCLTKLPSCLGACPYFNQDDGIPALGSREVDHVGDQGGESRAFLGLRFAPSLARWWRGWSSRDPFASRWAGWSSGSHLARSWRGVVLRASPGKGEGWGG